MKALLVFGLLICVHGALSKELARLKRQEREIPHELKNQLVSQFNLLREMLANYYKIKDLKMLSWSIMMNMEEPNCNLAFDKDSYIRDIYDKAAKVESAGQDINKQFDAFEHVSYKHFFNCLDPLQTQIRMRVAQCGNKAVIMLWCGPFPSFDRKHLGVPLDSFAALSRVDATTLAPNLSSLAIILYMILFYLII